MKQKKVAIIMGSDSDMKVMIAATEPLRDFGIKYEIKIVSAHRTPKLMFEFAEMAEARNFGVIIAGAGGAAHLPGMVAAITPLPVIGVPVNQTRLKGLDALLSVAQMPKGVPVATVAIDNAFNAGLLAAKILASSDTKLLKKIKMFHNTQKKKVILANSRLKARHLY
ncbi:MAG: 5-(carboxyamino)imidazole ribonucleotide mutase [Proteobacteria bacterium SG_bin7]|nr:MAG: 5-(carboxyamino)imidazole ribonucleotide mutase [Proteobacteria bacterium SG_bin7]